MVSRNEMRNGLVGVAVSFATLAIGLVFFQDAGEGAWDAIVLFAFAVAFVVAHALDELERRPKHHRDDAQSG